MKHKKIILLTIVAILVIIGLGWWLTPKYKVVTKHNGANPGTYKGTAIGTWFNGYTEYTSPENTVIKGQFKLGTSDGYAKIYSNGQLSYEGQVYDGSPNGYGKIYKNGILYCEGNIDKQWHPNGYCIFYTDAGIYKGEAKNGRIDGYGEITVQDQYVVKSHFKNGVRDGFIQFVYKDGSKAQGISKDGKIVGKITVIDKNNNIIYTDKFPHEK